MGLINRCLPQGALSSSAIRSTGADADAALSRSSRVLDVGSDSIDSATETESKRRIPDGREVVAYIVAEMVEHTSTSNADFAAIKKLLDKFKALSGPSAAPAARVTALFEALATFAGVVGYGKRWDQKSQIRARWGKESELAGVRVPFDVWSNIHYGFVGLQVGFNAELLHRAAGFVQALQFAVPDGWLGRWLVQDLPLMSSLDDPRDQEAISIGILLSEKYGRSVSPTDLIAAMRPKLGRLIEV